MTVEINSLCSPKNGRETRISYPAQCQKKNGGFRLMTSPFCVRVSLLFLSITITGEVLITLPHLCASLLWQILIPKESGCAKSYKHTTCVYKWGEVLLLLLCISHTQDLIISLLKLNSHVKREMLSHSLSGHITHYNNYLEILLVRTTIHVGVWEDSPDYWCWNTNAVLRKCWRMAVSCCRC